MKIRLFLTASLLSVLLFTSCSNDDPSSDSAFSNGPAELPAWQQVAIISLFPILLQWEGKKLIPLVWNTI